MSDVFLDLRNVVKRFSGVAALDDVSLTIRSGEIHCLAGENGSGKSTVIKVMSGVYRPDSGSIAIDGRTHSHLTPIEAIRHGIQVIYQDFSLFGNLTVAENLALNTELRNKRKLVNWRSVRDLARRALDRLGVDIDPEQEVDELSTAGRQLVAIARALMSDPRLLIMDEPTTALTRKEVETMFRIVRDIQAHGISILFVSHKMREMLEISERLSVIRNGRMVAEGPTSNFDESTIVRHMTGHDISSETYHWKAPATPTPPRLEIAGLTLAGAFEDLALSVHPGEIVGLSGLLGSGRTEVAQALFGLEPGHTGTVRIDGVPVPLDRVQTAIDAGIAYVPEDRLTEGLFLTQSIDRNILATIYERIADWSVIDRPKAANLAASSIKALQIATPTGDKPVGELSGGNQQRVVLARWLLTEAKVLILNGPTVGVDVGSKAEIHRIIRDLAVEKGLAVVMISDDILELVQNCNRIVVMHRGRFVETFETADTSEQRISDMLTSFK
ncbi:sugar ABC transporter ATP-binding protein [Siculibacillus lacustris]|uniref:Sugar ABC transporter ATP-binding protein n=1 Tax=Siculibacillus lacustris TaxID=1549641 RepID=A0A4Q9VY15_9HYPH|nr:sugar ABC transporter ATP-binding protein [Siculibacillus lacustris]TBW41399.1 sugar ABC transporter ATP-binding protein [Siculibacillus lacustris]